MSNRDQGSGPESGSGSGHGVTVVIIGRAGSRGLPGKNAMEIAGRPMLTYSIEAAQSCPLTTRTIVSTDCQDLQRVARQSGIDVVDRPAELARDDTPIDDAVRHAVEDDASPTVVILYANVPVRPAGLIERAVRELWTTGADSVQSYAPVGKYHPYWEVTIDPQTGAVAPFIENDVYRRQDLSALYVPDGGVIAVTRQALFAGAADSHPHAFLGQDRRGIMNDAGAVIDIDSEIDLEVARAILTRQRVETRRVG